ncbi:4'-phosphopantetheinyl transferase superfamily protein [Mitsuaria sp. GD03876]|uniref:4'-phosphopantetheinyl transferase family protein n=1 Tax=Mitsuaria sp. GD03876 TaxID=2975399 RepID=UPI00244ADA46|nr:4'-phosphopantetheinyl transferase superfamily protein [Mitsuaria sp. GD03876]MDH0864404.1 4'-phosphopantetheinyl transferase superfamily protein [Mitsuaria sp. GD03876]
MRALPLPDVVAPRIEVFELALDLAAPLPDEDWALLDDDERRRARRLLRHPDQVRFVRTRAALRRLLAERLRRRPRDLRFTLNRHGKPRLCAALRRRGPLAFNVAHAGSFALIALSARGPVGVDIECRSPALDPDELAPTALSPMERHLRPGERVDFLDGWTAKEAVLKALGLGIGEHLQRLAILRPEAGRHQYGLRHEAFDLSPVTACRLPAPDGYAASLAWLDLSPLQEAVA